jgi:hypothetical protein
LCPYMERRSSTHNPARYFQYDHQYSRARILPTSWWTVRRWPVLVHTVAPRLPD